MVPRSVVLALVIVAALLVGACVTVQTPAGFRGVVVPLANLFAPGEIEVQRGRLGLLGSLEVEALRYAAPELGVEVTAADLAVDVSLPSLLTGAPRVELLRLHDARIVLQIAEGEDEAPEPGGEGWRGRLPPMPAAVGEADVRNLVLEITEPQGARTVLGPLNLTVSGLLPGESGRITLHTPLQLKDPVDEVDYDGTLALEAELRQTPGGRIEQLTASARGDVAGASAGGATRFVLDLAGADSGEGGIDASLDLRGERGGQPLGQASARLRTERADDGADVATASLALRSITESFLNPLVAPLGRGLVSRASLDGELDLAADWPFDASQPPRRARGELRIDRFDYRALAVSSARATVEAGPGTAVLELSPTRINGGSVSGKVSYEARGEQAVIDAALRTRRLDLGALSTTFHEQVPNRVEGLLDLSAALASEAPAGADLRETAAGRVVAHVDRGRIEGFNIMSFLADRSGVDAFRAIPLDDFAVDAQARISGGVAQLREAEVRSTAVELVVNGTVALAGRVDLTIEAFVGPSLTATLERLGVELPTLAAAEKLVGVPAAIRVRGPVDDLSYGAATPRTTERLRETGDTGTRRLEDAADKVKRWLR